MGRVRFSGPVKSDGGFEIGSGIGTNTEVINSSGEFVGVVKGTTINGASVALTSAATVTCDWDSANVYTLLVNPVALGAAVTVLASGGTAGQRGTLIVTASSTSATTLTFSSSYRTTGTMSTSTTPAYVHVIDFQYDGTKWNEVARTGVAGLA